MEKATQFRQTDVLLIVGQRGSGKTILGKYLTRSFANKMRTFIFDPMAEFQIGYGKVVYNLSEINLEEDKHIVYNPIKNDSIDEIELYDQICKFVWEKMPNTLFVTDELHNYESKALTRYYRKLITQGRHRNIGMIGISQRYALLNQTTITQSSHIFIFRLIGRDIEVSRQYFGAEIEPLLRNLQEYHFIHFDTRKQGYELKKPISSEIAKNL